MQSKIDGLQNGNNQTNGVVNDLDCGENVSFIQRVDSNDGDFVSQINQRMSLMETKVFSPGLDFSVTFVTTFKHFFIG